MSFNVKITPSGHEFEIAPEETILESALRHGHAFAYGCRAGSCGACKGKILEGEFFYQDNEPPLAAGPQDEENSICVFCQAYPLSDLVLEIKEISAAKDIAVKTLPCRVAKMEKIAPEVMRVYLKLPMIERLQFLAGQYVDILYKDGRRRSFSMANPPCDDEFIRLHIRYIEGGEFTGYVFNEMQEKDLLRIEGPFGSFFLREDSDRPIVLMAGGTGFAPMKSILEHAFSEGVKRPIYLYWGARHKDLLYMPELPESWAKKYDNFHFVPVLSEAKPEDNWQGRSGLVHLAVGEDFKDLSDFDVYASGQPNMIEAGRDLFVKQGMDEDHFYFDSFTFGVDCI